MILRSTGDVRAPARLFSKRHFATLAIAVVALWASAAGQARAQQPVPSILAPGDAVVTGFSGTVPPSPPPAAGIDPLDETFIDPAGASARILRLQPAGPPAGQLIPSPTVFSAKASDVGQVFAITLDDAAAPNIYLGATSAFGIQIVTPDSDSDGRPERVKTGQAGATFMAGQWGQGGSPGSIYKIDGTTGAVSLFTTIGADAGPGLGDLVYDRASQQFFVSDLDTGLIYRLDSTGAIIDTFDHGVNGRPAHGLAAVADDGSAMDITNPAFNAEDPATWGYTQKERRVGGMAFHNGRLYYAVNDATPSVWSIGINLDGSFAGDARWELDVTGLASANGISDMLFDGAGRMVLAQRGPQVGSYDYSVFATPQQSSVVRYKREIPDDPSTPGTWVPVPDEYAIGFRPEGRNTDGGVALGYAYDQVGGIRSKACRQELWTTGESLRDDPALAAQLASGGEAVVHGLQGNDAGLVKPQNDPPFQSYFADYDGNFGDPQNQGHLGDVETYAPCQGGQSYIPPYFPPPPAPPPSNLTIFKQAQPHTCLPDGGGYDCHYTIRVANTGSTIFWGPLAVEDWLPGNPAGAVVTFDLQPPWACGPSTPWHFTCDYPPVVLFPGEGVDLYVHVFLPPGDLVCHLSNGARIYRPFGPADSNPSDDVAFGSAKVPNPFCPGPSGSTTNLKLTKDVLTPACIDGGAAWVCGFAVTITNTGPGNYTGDIVFNDTFSVGTPVVAFGAGWLCTLPGPGHTCTLPGASIPGGVLSPTDSVQVQLWTAIPKAGFSTCFVNNQAKIFAAPGGSALNLNPGDDSDSKVAAVPIPGCKPPGSTNLSIKKTAWGDGCYLDVGPRWACTFVVTVKNESLVNDFSGSITFHDTFMGFVPVAPSPIFSWPFCGPDGGGYTCSGAGVLHPGDTWETLVTAYAPDDGTVCSITNKVDLTSPVATTQNTVAGDDTSTIVIPVPATGCPSNLQITKTRLGGDFCTKVPGGWTCPYSVEVRNTGPVGILAPISVKEEVPAGLGFIWDPAVVGCAGGPPTWTCTYVGLVLASGDRFTFAATILVPDGYPVPPDPAFPAAPDLCHIPNKVSFITPLAPANALAGDDHSEDTLRINMVPDPAAPPGAAPVPCDPPSLKLEKIADPKVCTKAASGFDCSFVIKATSTGPDPYHGTVELDETLPAGSTLTSFSAPWTCAGATPAVHCSYPPVDMAVGDSVELKLTVNVPDSLPKSGVCEVTNQVQATISAAVLHSATAAQYSASATATIPSDSCVKKPACPILQKQPDGGCCPEGQIWLGTACGVRSIAKCPAGTTGSPPNGCLCPDGQYASGKPLKCPGPVNVCPRGSKPTSEGCLCPDGQYATGKPLKCPKPVNVCPFGSQPTSEGCLCPDGQYASGKPLKCPGPVNLCPRGSTPTSEGCLCPDGQYAKGKPLKCPGPVNLCPRGSQPTSEGCLCADGQYASGKPLKCPGPLNLCPRGSQPTSEGCLCADGQYASGKPLKCPGLVNLCPRGSTPTSSGCLCANGQLATGKPLKCPAPVNLCPRGTTQTSDGCQCPDGQYASGKPLKCPPKPGPLFNPALVNPTLVNPNLVPLVKKCPAGTEGPDCHPIPR